SAAQGLDGNEAPAEALRVVTAALLTVEDAILRAEENGAGKGAGLRGGSYAATRVGAGYHLLLRKLRWTEELSVSGEADWPGRSGEVRALLELDTPELRGKLQTPSPEDGAHTRALVHGRPGGRTVAAEAPAP